MSEIQAIFLGIIQGLTEFFPISSSGHLALGQKLLGLNNLDKLIIFNLICHLGTLLSILYFFRNEIKQLLFLRARQVILATLPLFPLVLILKPLKQMFDKPEYLGFCFLFTALLLYVGQRFGKEVPQPELKKTRSKDALFIGLSQAVAILPGISRSGSTISMARLRGWNSQDATTFSFLLAIPAILGGIALECLQLLKGDAEAACIPLTSYLLGFSFSFIFGLLALTMMTRALKEKKIMGFVWYCVIVGILSFCIF